MRKPRHTSSITIASQLRTASIKVYIEQLMEPDVRALYEMAEEYLDKDYYIEDGRKFTWTPALKASAQFYMHDQYEAAKQAFYDRVRGVDKKYFIFTICHDQDQIASKGDFFKPAFKKPHFHIWVWRAKDARFRIATVLKLLGITYTQADNSMIFEHGIEPIKSKSASLMYATHETPQAIADGKTEYSVDDIVTNQDKDTILAIRDGYAKAQPKKKLSDDDWDVLAREAYELGTKAGDYDKWKDTVMTTRQQGQRTEDIVHDKYVRGLSHYMGYAPDLVRCSILIYGAKGLGKSHSARAALQAVCKGAGVYLAKKGSGKYDELSPSSMAMLFDDVTVTSAKNVFDNYPCSLYRRNSADRPWLGTYAVVTTNGDPWSWVLGAAGYSNRKRALRDTLDYCKEKSIDFIDANAVNLEDAVSYGLYANEIEDLQAIASRLYICTVDLEGNLVVEEKQRRGHDVEHDKLFHDFQDAFEKSLKPYALSKLREKQNKGEVAVHPLVMEAAKKAEMKPGDYLEKQTIQEQQKIIEEQQKKLLQMVDDDLPF